MRESQREQTPGPDRRRPGFTGLRQALNSGLAFFALCALLMGVVWAVNAPTVKASDPPPGACSEVCTVNAACTQPCTGEVPMTCGEYGVCAVLPACATTCTTSTACSTLCAGNSGAATTCDAWGTCDRGAPPPTPTPTPGCDPATCATQCCTAGCAAKPTFSASAAMIMAGESVTFTMTSANTDPNDSAWNFGDGTPEVRNQGQVTHTYSTPGTYQARLTAGDLVCGMWLGSELAAINVLEPGGGGGEDECKPSVEKCPK